MQDNSNISTTNFEQKYNLKQMEINSLLEITQAINNNMSEENLYKIYEFTIRANLVISQLVLIVKDEEDWDRKVIYGLNSIEDMLLDKNYLEIDEVTAIAEPDELMGFEWAIPVKHKDKMLAIVLVAQAHGQVEQLNTTFLQAISNLIIVAIENKKLARTQLEEESFLIVHPVRI